MPDNIKPGSVDVTVELQLRASDGTPADGLAYDTSGLTIYYRRGPLGTPTAITLATQTVGGAHSDGGFVELDGTNALGGYRLDLPDAVCAIGVPYATIWAQGTGLDTTPLKVNFPPYNGEAIPHRDIGALRYNTDMDGSGSYPKVPIDLGIAGPTITKADVLISVDNGNFAAVSHDQGASDAGASVPTGGSGQIQLLEFAAADLSAAGFGIKGEIYDAGKLICTFEGFIMSQADYDAAVANGLLAGINAAVEAGQVGTDVTAILADTNELQTDDYPTLIAAVQAAADAIQAVTDALTFTVAGKVDANITHVIADPVQASSGKTTNWGGTP